MSVATSQSQASFACRGLRGSLWRVSLLTLFAIAATSQTPPLPVLTRVAAVHELSPEQAAQHYPVALRGVVTGSTGWKGTFFIQDKTGGVYVEGAATDQAIIGSEVELHGVTNPGQYAPIVEASKVERRGPGQFLAPHLPSYADLLSGQEDSQWIEVSGVVLSATVFEDWGRPILMLNIDLGPGTISTRILKFNADYSNLVGARVRIQGVGGTAFNDKRQLIGVRLNTPDIKFLTVEKAAADPFQLPLTEITQIQQFRGINSLLKRVKVNGTVIYQNAGRALYLQSGNDGIVVRTHTLQTLAPGTAVEASGFINSGRPIPELRDAFIRPVGQGREIVPARIAADQAIQRSNGSVFAPFDGTLVEIDGDVVNAFQQNQEEIVVLRDHNAVFQARLEQPGHSGRVSSLSAGSRIRVRGVCLSEFDENRQPRAFHLLMRSPADLVVLHAPWWTTGTFLWIFAALVLTLFGLLIRTLQMGRRGVKKSAVSTEGETEARFRLLSRAAGVLGAAIGLMVLVGGALPGIAGLRSMMPGCAAIGPLTALCTCLTGVAVWIEASSRTQKFKWRTLLLTASVGMTALVAAFASGLPSNQTLGAFDYRVAHLLPASPIALAMALVLVVLSLGLLLLHSGRAVAAAQVAVLAGAAFCLFNTVGYLFGAPGASRLPVPAALALLLLCFGVLFSHAEQGVMRAITSASPGGFMVRTLLPAAVLIPVALGWLTWQGQSRGYYEGPLGITLFISGNIVVFSLLLWTSATLLNSLDVERTDAERHLRESEANFRQLAEALPQMVWIADPGGQVEYTNTKWCEYTGQSMAQSLNTGWQPVVHPEDLEQCVAFWGQSLATGEPYNNEYRLRQVHGFYRWHLARALPLRDSNGSITRWFGTATDIHMYKEAEERIWAFNQQLESRVEERTSQLLALNDELSQMQASLQSVLDSATQVSIVALDEHGIIQLFNAGAEAMLQYTASEVIGKHTPLLYLSPEDCEKQSHEASERLKRPVQQNEIYSIWALPERAFLTEAEVIRKDGARLRVSVAVAPLINDQGRRLGTLRIATDITQRKELEQRLQENNLALHEEMIRAGEASRAKTDFLARMSHEIRTPLNVIIGMAEMLAETTLTVDQSKFVELTRCASASLFSLVNDILDLSKIESGHLELETIEFKPAEVVEQTAQMMSLNANQKGLSLVTRLGPGLPDSLLGDPARLQQILFNLLGNAVKFTETGDVLLSVETRATANRARVRFEVSDTGVGIAADRLDPIFDDFQQADPSTARRFGGTGLGLGICRRLVRLMGGELIVESEPGKGSTFWFEASFGLPTLAAASEQAEPASTQSVLLSAPEQHWLATDHSIGALAEALNEPDRKVKILLADDSEENRFLVKVYLKNQPYELTFAEDGQQACELFLAGSYDLVLMDMQMPKMDGITATRRIRTLEMRSGRSRTPILALTANAQPDDLRLTQATGFDSHLSKPLFKQQLLEAIQSWALPGEAGGRSGTEYALEPQSR